MFMKHNNVSSQVIERVWPKPSASVEQLGLFTGENIILCFSWWPLTVNPFGPHNKTLTVEEKQGT